MNRFGRTLLVLAVVVTLPAEGHTPARLRPGEPFVAQKPTDSYGLYGEFVTGDEVFVVRLSYEERFALPIEIFVPHEAKLKDHRPAFAIVAAGLPQPSSEELAALPSPLAAGQGAIVELNQASPRPAFFESILRRFYWSSGALGVVLPRGDVEIWVWSPQKTHGKFGLGFGVEEGGGYMAALADWSFYAY